MGKTQSIEREAQSNQNFQNYLESLHKQLEDKTNTDFEKNRKSFYDKNGYDCHTLGTSMKWDFRQQNSFEPARIKDSVETAAKSILGGGSVTGAAAKGISMLAGYESVATSVGVSVVLAAMNICSTSMKITYNEQYTDAPICPGVTLHILTFSDSFQRVEYFDNQTIIETGIRYELCFSEKKARAEATMANMISLVEIIRKYNQALLKLETYIAEGIMTLPFWEIDELNERSKRYREMLNRANAEIAKAGGPTANKLPGIENRALLKVPAELPPDRLAIYQDVLQRMQ